MTSKKNLNDVLTNPDRIMYPEENISKLEIAEYYAAAKDWILPYLIERPLTLVRCPQGQAYPCFFQKHLHDAKVPALHPINIKEKTKTEEYIYIEDIEGVISLVQLGVLEIHMWNCHIQQIEKPDLIIFDLDPAPEISWKKVIDTAKRIRDKLAKLKLKSFVKTTGGKGLHVVVPIKPQGNWDTVKAFAHAFTTKMVEDFPDEYIDTMSKAKRKGKIFIDYLRNTRGATSIAPYSTRARKNASVSVPLAWDELTTKIKPDYFTIKNLPKRLKNLKKDPWKDFLKTKQSLPKKFI